MASDLFHSLIAEFAKVIAPLRDAAEDPDRLESLLAQVGATSDSAAGDPLAAALAAVVALADRAQELDAEPSPSFASIAALLEAIRNAVLAVHTLSEASGPAAALETFGVDLLEWLILSYLWNYHPQAYNIAVLATLITPAEDTTPRPPILDGDTVKRMPFQQAQFRFDRLKLLFTDPLAALKAEYGTPLLTVADANAMADKLFPRVLRVLRGFDVPVSYGFNPIHAELLGDSASFVDHALIVYTADTMMDAEVEAGVVISLSSADRGDLGFVFNPFGTLAETWDLGKWKLELDLTAQVQGFAVGRHGFTLSADASVATVGGKFTATLAAPDQGPAYVVGSPAGTRLEIGGAEFDLETTLSEVEQTLAASAAVLKSVLVVQSADGDGFLRSILPADGLKAQFDLGIAWSDKTGFSFHGAAGLDATLPVGISIGGVLTVPTIHLGLYVNDLGLQAEVSASVSLSIGPVQAVVDRVGVLANLGFPDDGGNLGIADLSFGFKPPSGVGLAIDAPGVSGGGFLSFDQEKGQYAGVMQLNVEGGLTLTAIGVISTHLPNGAKGYSFVVLITAEGFEPIPLGLGFTLTGIGGLLAINRTCNEEFLREGIKSNTLDSLLFPTDPIRNAVQIFGTLNNAFPPREGSYLFGPVVQICWGAPAILTMDLGLILELGNRERLIVLGRVSAIMPTEKQDLIRLQMNVLGIIDFDQHTISVDAVLYDSRLVGKFPITGSMAMRLNWGSAPLFALSVGGLHPAFKPPADFPTLERLAISFSNTDDFRLRAEAYIAITSNTYQYGARLELYARAGGFSIAGQLGYDVLIQFDPFGFVADFYASVQLKYHSDNLFAVKVEGELAGPKPLHIKGKATFEIFWCSFSVGFDHMLLQGDPPPLLAPVEVIVQLKAALGDARNWSGQLADGDRRMVTLRERPAPDQIALHPLGRLAVRQKVVPLELEIAKFGNAKPADAQLFKINSLSVNGQSTPFSLVTDFFAPAQFLELADDEKLTAPSFEELTAGISTGSQGFLFTTNDLDILEDDKITYETVIVDRESNTTRPAPPVAITAAFLDRHISLGAAARCEVRSTGTAKYRVAGGKNSLVKKGWMIASTADGSAQAAPGMAAGEVVSYAQSSQALRKLRQLNPAGAKSMMLLRVAA